jgi:hypothetical protein
MIRGLSWKAIIVWAMWVFVVIGGMTGLAIYASSPGAPAAAPRAWPAGSELHRTPGVSTLVMMSHPHCPCTRASITELAELMSQFRNQLTTYVLFIQPEGVDDAWTNTDLWQSASRIPGVHPIRDNRGVEAARFDGLTSGTVVLYDSDGRLQFNGGITAARGHIGDNLGLQRIIALLKGEEPDRGDSPVFGCPLHTPELARSTNDVIGAQ